MVAHFSSVDIARQIAQTNRPSSSSNKGIMRFIVTRRLRLACLVRLSSGKVR
jgi:hypothetical protein